MTNELDALVKKLKAEKEAKVETKEEVKEEAKNEEKKEEEAPKPEVSEKKEEATTDSPQEKKTNEAEAELMAQAEQETEILHNNGIYRRELLFHVKRIADCLTKLLG